MPLLRPASLPVALPRVAASAVIEKVVCQLKGAADQRSEGLKALVVLSIVVAISAPASQAKRSRAPVFMACRVTIPASSGACFSASDRASGRRPCRPTCGARQRQHHIGPSCRWQRCFRRRDNVEGQRQQLSRPRMAVASSKAIWTVGWPRRRSSLSMAGDRREPGNSSAGIRAPPPLAGRLLHRRRAGGQFP